MPPASILQYASPTTGQVRIAAEAKYKREGQVTGTEKQMDNACTMMSITLLGQD